MVGLSRLELLTSRLSGVRSNQLSYRPILGAKTRFLCMAVSFSRILRSTYVSVRLPWILLHSLPYAKLSLCLVLLGKGKFFASNFVMSSNSAVDVPFRTTLLNLPSFLVIHQSFCFAQYNLYRVTPDKKRWWRRGESNS